MANPIPLPLPSSTISTWHYITSQVQMYGPSSATDPGNAVYVQTHLPTVYGPQQEGVWHTVDLKPLGVSEQGKVAFLSGLLIITHGTTVETADLQMSLRAHNSGEDPTCIRYLPQVIETAVGGGQRCTFSTFVPLNNGMFDFYYRLSTPGSWPTNSAYGINMSLQMWGE